jgi:hypothetical protein
MTSTRWSIASTVTPSTTEPVRAVTPEKSTNARKLELLTGTSSEAR